MNTLEQTTINGYDIELSGSILNKELTLNIKYACGDLVARWEINNPNEIQILLSDFLKDNEFAYHEYCTDEYCQIVNNKNHDKVKIDFLDEIENFIDNKLIDLRTTRPRKISNSLLTTAKMYAFGEIQNKIIELKDKRGNYDRKK